MKEMIFQIVIVVIWVVISTNDFIKGKILMGWLDLVVVVCAIGGSILCYKDYKKKKHSNPPPKKLEE